MSRYKFASVESAGLFGELTSRQVVAAGSFLAASYASLQILSGGVAIFVAAAIGATGFWFVTYPVAGRPLVDWLATWLRFQLRQITGRSHYKSDAPSGGHAQARGGYAAAQVSLPEELSDIEILGATYKGQEVGVAFDKREGAYSATIAVTSDGFALQDPDRRESNIGVWASVVAQLAREDCPITRIQWVEQTLPANQDGLMDYLKSAIDPELSIESPNVLSYVRLLSGAAEVQQEHEILVTLRLDKRSLKTRKMAARLGRGHEGFCALLMRELDETARALSMADVRVLGALYPRSLARVLASAYNPYGLKRQREKEDGLERGIDPATMGPMDAIEDWAIYETDGALHSTYWIAEWPRIPVDETFMSPLLLGATGTRAIAVTIEPIPLVKAMKQTEAAATAIEGEADLRAKHQFRVGHKLKKKYQAIDEREAELTHGHAEVRFSGFVTVSAKNDQELESACAQTEHAAQQSHIDLRLMGGEQGAALTFTMPLARGLRGGFFS